MPITNQVIDEFHTVGYITMALPTLFPFGKAYLREDRFVQIDPSKYFQYLMKFKDCRFAKDSRFRYFAWNSICWWRALHIGDVCIKHNPGDAHLSIQDIQEMNLSGNIRLVQRISYYANSICGTRSYWHSRL